MLETKTLPFISGIKMGTVLVFVRVPSFDTSWLDCLTSHPFLWKRSPLFAPLYGKFDQGCRGDEFELLDRGSC